MFMNVFRKTLFLLLPVVMKAHAADPIFVVDSHYVTVEKLEYWSVDAFNNPILLSEEVYYNKYYSNFKSVLSKYTKAKTGYLFFPVSTVLEIIISE